MYGLGMTADTKPSGCQVAFRDLNLKYQGPGSILFGKNGWDYRWRHIPQKLFPGDVVTGYTDTTNTNEGAVLGMDIAYGAKIPAWSLESVAPYLNRVYTDFFTITSAAAVTYNSGAVGLKTALTNYATWINPDKQYVILGVGAVTGGATFGGILHVTNLGGDWEKSTPGIPVGVQDGNTTPQMAGNDTAPLSPIPFSGDSVPTFGMTASSAGAVKGYMLIGELK